MSFDNIWEKEIYLQGKHVNRYPQGEFVSIFFRALKFLDNSKDTVILELGSGTGNNLAFMSELGFNVYGVDGSKTACELSENFLNSKCLNAKIFNAEFGKLPFENNFFDMIVDRESTYCGTIDDIIKWWDDASRVLKRGGVIISFMYSDDNYWCKKAEIDQSIATKIHKNTFNNFNIGTFKNTGIINFASYEEILNIFKFVDFKLINKHSNETIKSSDNSDYSYKEWIIIGVKK